MTVLDQVTVGVVVAKRRLKSPWQDHAWLPVAVLPDAPDAPPMTPLGRDGDDERFYLGPAVVELHRGDAGNYRDNLLAERAQLWVGLRESGGPTPVELVLVTADPAEGEGLTQAGTEIVEPVPMPPDLAARLAAFVAEHRVERPFEKRKRDKRRFDERGDGPPPTGRPR
jgi:hypothetical protein